MALHVRRDRMNREAIVIYEDDTPQAYLYPSINAQDQPCWDFVSRKWGHSDTTFPTRREAVKALRERMSSVPA